MELKPRKFGAVTRCASESDIILHMELAPNNVATVCYVT